MIELIDGRLAMKPRNLIGISLSSLIVFVSTSAIAEARYEFSPVVAAWVTKQDDPHGRKMKLEKDFTFIDGAGVKWVASSGRIVDGASIPRIIWPILGGPYEGLYREASVVHDVACEDKTRPWEHVHRMFYEAMLTSGVDSSDAKIMYAAVYHFGPRWSSKRYADSYTNLSKNNKSLSMEQVMARRIKLSERIGVENVASYGKEPPIGASFKDEKLFLEKISNDIKNKNLTLEEIEKFR